MVWRILSGPANDRARLEVEQPRRVIAEGLRGDELEHHVRPPRARSSSTRFGRITFTATWQNRVRSQGCRSR